MAFIRLSINEAAGAKYSLLQMVLLFPIVPASSRLPCLFPEPKTLQSSLWMCKIGYSWHCLLQMSPSRLLWSELLPSPGCWSRSFNAKLLAVDAGGVTEMMMRRSRRTMTRRRRTMTMLLTLTVTVTVTVRVMMMMMMMLMMPMLMLVAMRVMMRRRGRRRRRSGRRRRRRTRRSGGGLC